MKLAENDILIQILAKRTNYIKISNDRPTIQHTYTRVVLSGFVTKWDS
jgi:hypothetical protein